MNRISQYFDEKNKERNWKDADLAREAKIDQSTLTKLRYEDGREPSMGTLKKIARAYRVPLQEVQIAAGFIPPVHPEDALITEILHITEQMDMESKEELMEYGRLVLARRAKKKRADSNPVSISA